MNGPDRWPPLPRLTAAHVPLTRDVLVVSADGSRRQVPLAAERALTLYVDRQELVTLMTLGQEPELLALGYLLNQGLVASATEIESITVDWDVAAAAVHTRHGVSGLAERLARRTVTTGCGQGTVFGDWLDRVPPLPPATQDAGSVEHAVLVQLLDAMRALPSIHREAGSVHGTALWQVQQAQQAQRESGGLGAAGEPQMLVHVEDVGRHNAVDTVAGWMAMEGVAGEGCWLYTTGRLTSEMVLKAAQLRIPLVVSRNGATAMGQQLAEQLHLTLIGRAGGGRYLCYSGAERLRLATD
ncbi:MAG: formate dehydrogenase accessory sulfurtransferase FdhD [Burkholderiales bacterium]|nr:formate dehydrogenase accessory sulfurtransferase FdhD [Burkholderiales bacterium]